MAKISCCRRHQTAKIFKITPTRENTLEEFIFYLEKCNFCEGKALEIIRVNFDGRLMKPVRLRTKNINKFLGAMNVIWQPKKIQLKTDHLPRFVLYYNEYGKHKACKSNLSSLSLGKIETNPLAGLKKYNFQEKIAI